MTAAAVHARAPSPLHGAILFLILGFPLSWYPWLWALLSHRGTSGPNPLGLLAAALIAAAVSGGWRGARGLASGIVRVRVAPVCWAVALLAPVVILAGAALAARAAGIHLAIKPPVFGDLLDRFVFVFLFVALGEEPAWRGFLLPRLERAFSPVIATLLVACVWAIWHLPLMGSEFPWPVVPAFLVSLAGGAFVLSWLYNASRGSILLPMILHALLNTIGAGYVFHLVAAQDQIAFWWIYAAVWLAAGLLATLLTRGRLGFAGVVT